jgi:HPt (histidine-containing phosphotransfer) domain-containing protein
MKPSIASGALGISAKAGLPPVEAAWSLTYAKDAFISKGIPMAATTPASPIFDYAGAMERMGQDEQLFQDMVDYLHRDGPRWMEEVKAAAAAEDLPRVQYRAHSLKGLISNFGAARAWQAAAALEEQAKARKADGLSAAVATLSAALGELIEALASHRAKDDRSLSSSA